jgi:hypothetical protein
MQNILNPMAADRLVLLLLGLFLIFVVAIVSTSVISPDNDHTSHHSIASHFLWYQRSVINMTQKNEGDDSYSISLKDSIKVAHLGNSIQYYNDMPRLLEHMLRHSYISVQQDSCLRGGATLRSLWKNGNGMGEKFATDAAKREDGSYDVGAPTIQELLEEASWDFVVVNDHTQSPARPEKKEESETALKNHYIPLFLKCQATMVVFVQTPAYKTPVKDSADLGTFDEFTEKIWHGYEAYAKLVRQEGSDHDLDAKVAPVGLAYQAIKQQDHELWVKLYARDDFHPSPHGTLLEASVVYCTIVGEVPPVYDALWWETARYMQPPETEPLPLPTSEEAAILQDVAWSACQNWEGRQL